MKKMINLTTIAASLLLTALSVSCASLANPLLIPLRERTLLISLERGGTFEYTWRECAERFIVCTKWKQVKEYYDLNDALTAHKLYNMGFALRVK
jgi:hypothetical protein